MFSSELVDVTEMETSSPLPARIVLTFCSRDKLSQPAARCNHIQALIIRLCHHQYLLLITIRQNCQQSRTTLTHVDYIQCLPRTTTRECMHNYSDSYSSFIMFE